MIGGRAFTSPSVPHRCHTLELSAWNRVVNGSEQRTEGLLDAEEVRVQRLAAAVDLDLDVGVLVGEPPLDRRRGRRVGIGSR